MKFKTEYFGIIKDKYDDYGRKEYELCDEERRTTLDNDIIWDIADALKGKKIKVTIEELK